MVGWRNAKKYNETFRNDRYVHRCDCSDGLNCVYIG